MQSGHEVHDQVEEEDRYELERDVNDVEGELIGRGTNHGVLTVTNDDWALSVGCGDLGHAGETARRGAEDALAASSRPPDRVQRPGKRETFELYKIAKKITPPREKNPPVSLGIWK